AQTFVSSAPLPAAWGLGVTYGVSAGSIRGAGLSNCGDSSHALAWNSATGQFSCQSITGSGAAGLLNSTNTWTAQQNFNNQITISSNVVVNNGGVISGNGSGLTSLTPGNLSAGSLPGNVIASSIAVNAVVPANVANGVYGNITGLGTQTQDLAMGGFRVTGSSTTSADAATTLATKGYVDASVSAGSP